jgi:hypothetical protein
MERFSEPVIGLGDAYEGRAPAAEICDLTDLTLEHLLI